MSSHAALPPWLLKAVEQAGDATVILKPGDRPFVIKAKSPYHLGTQPLTNLGIEGIAQQILSEKGQQALYNGDAVDETVTDRIPVNVRAVRLDNDIVIKLKNAQTREEPVDEIALAIEEETRIIKMRAAGLAVPAEPPAPTSAPEPLVEPHAEIEIPLDDEEPIAAGIPAGAKPPAAAAVADLAAHYTAAEVDTIIASLIPANAAISAPRPQAEVPAPAAAMPQIETFERPKVDTSEPQQPAPSFQVETFERPQTDTAKQRESVQAHAEPASQPTGRTSLFGRLDALFGSSPAASAQEEAARREQEEAARRAAEEAARREQEEAARRAAEEAARREQEEAARRAAEEAVRREQEEAARRAAEEAARREQEEAARRAAEEAARREQEEAARRAAEEAARREQEEAARRAAEEAARREQEEAARRAAEEAARREQEEAARRAAEEAARREQEEAARRAAEEAARREQEEAARRAAEEAARREQEEAARRAAEEAARREQEEAARRAAEEAVRREQEEAARRAAEEAARREQEEAARRAAEEAARREQEEAARRAAEEAARREQEEAARRAAEEAVRREQEEAARRAAEEAARREQEEAARRAAEEAVRREQEEAARRAAEEAARREQEEAARRAAEEAARREQEEAARRAAEEAARREQEYAAHAAQHIPAPEPVANDTNDSDDSDDSDHYEAPTIVHRSKAKATVIDMGRRRTLDVATAQFGDWIKDAMDRGATALYLRSGKAPAARVDGKVENLASDALPMSMFEQAGGVMTGGQDGWRDAGEWAWSKEIAGAGTVRCQAFSDGQGGGFIVQLPVPVAALLQQVPRHIRAACEAGEGLVVIAAPFAEDVAAMVGAVVAWNAQQRAGFVVAFGAGGGLQSVAGESFVSERAMPASHQDMAAALQNALRERPDVVVVTANDSVPAADAIVSAAVGRLVIVGVVARTAPRALEVLLKDMDQNRRALTAVFRGACSWRGFRRPGGQRVVIADSLVPGERVNAMIEAADIAALHAAQAGRENGMRALDPALAAAVTRRKITLREAAACAVDRKILIALVRRLAREARAAEREQQRVSQRAPVISMTGA